LSGAKPLPLTLETSVLPFTLRLALPSREEIERLARAQYDKYGATHGASRVARRWADGLLARYDALSDTEDIQIVCVNIGGVPVFALPFETFSDTALRAHKAGDCLVLGNAGQMRGYLPTTDDIERGGYAGYESVYLYKRQPSLPGEAERLGDALAAAVGKR